MKTTKPIRRVLWLAVVSLFAPPVARAAAWYVATIGNDANPGTQSQPFRTIGRGMTLAVNGDSVLVADGTYQESNLDFGFKQITIKSLNGKPTDCILDLTLGGLSGYGFVILGGQPAGTTVISGFTLQNAKAPALYIERSSPTISNCIFSNNTANAIVNQSANATVSGCTFLANIGKGGGAILHFGGNLTVSRCSFLGNSSSENGGAIKSGRGIVNTANGNLALVDCVFSKNTATRDGGAVAIGAASVSSASVVHCTFAGNSGRLGQSLFSNGATVTVANSILREDFASLYPTAPMSVTYSDVKGWIGGVGNLDADPLFLRNPGTSGAGDPGDLHLQSNSPCLDRASASVPGLPSTDRDGILPRIIGANPEMGAYEVWAVTSGVWFVDRSLGSDSSPGSPTAPFASVTKAMTTATAGHNIYVKQGNYGNDRPRITKPLRLFNWGDIGLARIGTP